MADDVDVKFGANVQQLTEAVNAVKGQLSSLNGYVSQVGGYFSQLNNIGVLLAGTLGTLGLESFARRMAESGVETEKLTIALGVSGGELAKLKAVAGLVGVDMSGLALTMERLSLNVQRSTKDAFTPQAEALKVIGLQAKDLIGLNAAEMFDKIAVAAAKFNTSLNLTNALMSIGGRGMAEMVAAFVKGGGEFKELSDKIAKAKGDTDEFAKAATETHLALGFMDAMVSGLSKDIFIKLKPSIDTVIVTSREFVQQIKESIKEGGTWSYVLDGIALALKSVVVVIGALSLSFRETVAAILYWRDTWRGVDPAKAMKDFADRSREAGGDFVKMMDRLTGVTREGSKEVTTFSERWGALVSKQNANPIDFGGKERLAAAMKGIDEQIKMVELGFEKQKILYDADVLALRLTETQKIQAVSSASQQRYAAEVALYQKELQLYGLNDTQRTEIEGKITETLQKALNDRLQMQNAYVRQVQSEWGTIFQTIQSSWDGQLRGLLQGTVTWKNAMKNVFTDLVVAAISEFEKLAIVKPMIAALSEAFAPAAFFADILKTIMKMIGQVFAGATAFFAPTLGPAAPAAGAAVAAATEATALSYDTGAWSVPSTANALVHRDEMILPVDFASAVRSALTGGAMGGSSNMNLNIQAWDGASVARWLRTGGAQVLARAVSAQYNQNPTIRPSY